MALALLGVISFWSCAVVEDLQDRRQAGCLCCWARAVGTREVCPAGGEEDPQRHISGTRLSKCPWLGWLSWGAASPCWADCCTHRFSCIRVDSILPAAAMSLNQQERSLVWDKNHQCHLAGRMLELCWLWGRAWKLGRNAVLPKCAVL